MIKPFTDYHGAIRIYKKVFLNYENIINYFNIAAENSKNWRWKTSNQAIKSNEKQRYNDQMVLPVYKTNYSALNPNEHEKKLIVLSADIQERVMQHVAHYAKDFEIVVAGNEKMTLLRYGPGNFFKMHRDDHPITPRTFSTIYYINDNYIGGELYFKYFDFKYKPEYGDLVIFPSSYAYSHESMPISDGVKYAIVDFWNESIKNEK